MIDYCESQPERGQVDYAQLTDSELLDILRDESLHRMHDSAEDHLIDRGIIPPSSRSKN